MENPNQIQQPIATPAPQPDPQLQPTPQLATPPLPQPQPEVQPQPKKKHTGIIIGIIAIVLIAAIAIGCIFLIPAINKNNHSESNTSQDKDDKKTTKKSDVAGVWNCKSGGGNGVAANYSITIELNNDMTFRYGIYQDVDNNNLTGKYTYKHEKEKDEDDFKSYTVTLFPKKTTVNGKESDYEVKSDDDDSESSTAGASDRYEMSMGITTDDKGQTATVFFYDSVQLYACQDY